MKRHLISTTIGLALLATSMAPAAYAGITTANKASFSAGTLLKT